MVLQRGRKLPLGLGLPKKRPAVQTEDAILKDAFNKVKSVLEPYISISSEIAQVPDRRLPELMLRLMKDEALYKTFEKDPDEVLLKLGIDPKSLDLKMFSNLAKILHSRILRREYGFDWPAVTVQNKETNQSQDKNFDHSESWITAYESSYKVYKTKGTANEKEKSESSQTEKRFDESGVDTFDEKLLKYEVDMLFFPSQPLVTPELLEKIKASLNENKQ